MERDGWITMDEPTMFHHGDFTLHSGKTSNFKIDCDALSDGDLETIARLLVPMLSPFSDVEGVPKGGLRLAEHLAPYASWDASRPLLIVDDVLTTGGSMEERRGDREAVGAVIFARGKCPSWVRALFYMNGVEQ